jgi:hypothetical protein
MKKTIILEMGENSRTFAKKIFRKVVGSPLLFLNNKNMDTSIPYPCIRCWSKKYKRIICGQRRAFKIIQCIDCGYNVSVTTNFEDAVREWNSFKVYEYVKKSRLV